MASLANVLILLPYPGSHAKQLLTKFLLHAMQRNATVRNFKSVAKLMSFAKAKVSDEQIFTAFAKLLAEQKQK